MINFNFMENSFFKELRLISRLFKKWCDFCSQSVND